MSKKNKQKRNTGSAQNTIGNFEADKSSVDTTGSTQSTGGKNSKNCR